MKRLFSVVLAVLVLATSFAFLGAFTASAETLCVKKVVSVVYDDSGSMRNSDNPTHMGDLVKWAYASYAMQTFCGMLNENDELYITYMSKVEASPSYRPEELSVSSSGIQNSVDYIRNHDDWNGTTFESVELAMKKLEEVQDKDPNTQYWLVVLTDGQFYDKEKAEVNNILLDFTSKKMANESTPQITFMAIGADEDEANEYAPQGDESKGFFVEKAIGTDGIIDTLSEIAAKVSGRTQLDSKDINRINNRKIEVTSEVPIFNIAVLSQKSEAKVTRASYSSGASLDISRSANFRYPESPNTKTDESLVGSGCLIDNNGDAIKEGKYIIEFDKDIAVEDIVVLFEPALEVRINAYANGEPIGLDKLETVPAGQKISVECKVYEAGTDKEVPADKLPKGTDFSLKIFENGKQVAASDKSGKLENYELKETSTQIKATLNMPGFRPMGKEFEFTPAKYVPPTTVPSTEPTTTEPIVVYSVQAGFGSNVQSVKFDNITTNKDLTIEFTVFRDGERITNPDEIRTLNPSVTASPDGNSGTMVVSNDGKIIFTPNAARLEYTQSGYFDVTVTCKVAGVTASETYKVLTSAYAVIPVGTSETIKKTGFFGNMVGASFYIEKDGERLTKAEVESGLSVTLNEEYAHLKTDITVSEDGLITCVPYDETEYKHNWFVNWFYYWRLPGEDITISLSSPMGKSAATIDVVGESAGYVILRVWIPFILEVLIFLYIVRLITKPKFSSSATIYIGSLQYAGNGHRLESFSKKSLREEKMISSVLRPFKRTMAEISGVEFVALRGGAVACSPKVTGFGCSIKPESDGVPKRPTASQLSQYFQGRTARINIATIKPKANSIEPLVSLDSSPNTFYCVRATIEKKPVVIGNGKIDTITRACIFAYTE